MPQPMTTSGIAAGLVEQLTLAIDAVAGGSVLSAPAAATRGRGWSVTFTASGIRRGSFVAWIDATGAAAIGQLVLGGDAAPDDASTADTLLEMWSQAASALCLTSPFAGLKLAVGAPVATDMGGGAPDEFAITLAALGKAQVSISGSFVEEPVAAAVPAPVQSVVVEQTNLDLVLDIELPLVVRFGRTVMSLKALSDLGPGSIVDMGRSPDDPVELLVGERLIAKGEVVIVGGNYGVRVTDLISGSNTTRAAEAQ